MFGERLILKQWTATVIFNSDLINQNYSYY
ncbi:hypothetical protein Flavo103_43870 [Flavobacterium collinsii]|uniref:Uncharacterized protein n=1 Tax=Flavobacterium collinsii TaxID=1114861 RepID=A0ABM8KSA7_9FLAO|nr:hypothetical protein Flavo103_43870 [Flavobacterium collinsii]CAA9203245.1 hypothetical protein FLACOL7796_04656 [Flavobacterium collinsii]